MIETFVYKVPEKFKAIQFTGKNKKEIEEFTKCNIRENKVIMESTSIINYTLYIRNFNLPLPMFSYVVKEHNEFNIYDSYTMSKLFKNKSFNYGK